MAKQSVSPFQIIFKITLDTV